MENGGHEPGPESLPRRSFLRLAWQGILAFGSLCGLGGLLQFLNYQPQPPAPEKTLIGALEDFPPGSATVLPEARALVRREQTGLAVISLTCPHLGCMVEPTPEGFACPCHGSRYAPDGTLLRGPSRADLPRLALETTPEGVWVLHAD
jgi:Rieske Fe-S protein